MTVIQYLAAFADLLITRASKEGIAPCTVVYHTNDDGSGGCAITGPAGGCITCDTKYPLDGVLKDDYVPELTTEIWQLFLRQEKPHRFPPVPEALQ